MPNTVGSEGPYISRSSNPFVAKISKDKAKLADTVDLPTPPFPASNSYYILNLADCARY